MNSIKTCLFLLAFAASGFNTIAVAELHAGAAKVDITNRDRGPVNDPLHARALVLRSGETTVAVISMDVVSLGEIGHIGNDFLPNVRARLERDPGIPPRNVIINASHCHGVPADDTEDRTVQAVRDAFGRLEPATVGAGTGFEDRIMENRRLRLKSGREADVRHAYSLPPDEEVVGIGPVDPEIGILRIDRKSGGNLAVVYNYAGHPIQGAAGGGNTADITGFSSQVIEDNLADGTIALFLQGCGGDINPIDYKHTDHPRDGEPLGNMLGLSTLQAVRGIECDDDDTLKLVNETITLPRADLAPRIEELEAELLQQARSLRGTSLNLKTFLPLVVKYNLAGDYPSYYSHRYLHDEKIGRNHLTRLDAENRANMERYIRNIHTMERITRINTNLRLLRNHQRSFVAKGRTIDVELVALRVGDFRLITFPGEVVCQIGLNIKKAAKHDHTFVAGVTNGYIYYCPTVEQLRNRGNAQEDSECVLAPEWQALFENKAATMLNGL